MIAREWVRCPICSNKTRDRIREDTVLIIRCTARNASRKH